MKQIFSKLWNKQPVLTEDAQETSKELNSETVETFIPTISLHPEAFHEPENEFIYRYYNQQLPPLLANQVQLNVTNVEVADDTWLVTALVRHSLPQTVAFEDTLISLAKADGTIVAESLFPLQHIGQMPPVSARPYVFVFEDTTFFGEVSDADATDCKLLFTQKPKNELVFPSHWTEEQIADFRNSYRRMFRDPAQVGFEVMRLELTVHEETELRLLVLLRNSTENAADLSQIPLRLVGTDGTAVAQAAFQLNGCHIEGNTSMPWEFIFPKEFISEDVDILTLDLQSVQLEIISS